MSVLFGLKPSEWLLALNACCAANLCHRLINTVGACLAGADAICMAVLAVSVLAWEGTEHAQRADKAVVIIQLLVLVGEIVSWFCYCSIFVVYLALC